MTRRGGAPGLDRARRRLLLSSSLVLLSTSITSLTRQVPWPSARAAVFAQAALVIVGGFVAVGLALQGYRADVDAEAARSG